MSEARISLTPRTRLLTIAGVAALHLAAIVALVTAFGIETVITSVRSVAAFDVPIPPPPPPPPPETAAPEQQDKAAPPAARATPKPKPKVPIVIQPKPAPLPKSTGDAERSGARTTGAGSGGGGQGSGMSSGGSGKGSGGGLLRRAECVKCSGELQTKDFPKSGAGERDGRFIIVWYTVGTDGRARNCRVTQSSGSAEADAITCRLIEKRFRYRSALDAQGNPVASETGWKQWWWRPD